MNNMKTLAVALAMAMTMVAHGQMSEKREFPYPSVPDSLRTADTRATYVMAHYWDRFDFNDTLLINQPEIAEQGFANFLDLMPRVAPSTAAMGISEFVNHLYASTNADCRDVITDYFSSLIEKYLGQSDSPLHNEILYAQFVDVMSTNKFASLAERTRNGYMAANLKKNLPGMVATDFDYIDRKGERHRMHDIDATYTILFFYDPDCDHCRITANRLKALPQLSDTNLVRILAIYPYYDTEAWQHSKLIFPTWWTDAYSPEGDISANDIYYFKSMPSIYLLDSSKHVLLKNTNIEVLQQAITDKK